MQEWTLTDRRTDFALYELSGVSLLDVNTE